METRDLFNGIAIVIDDEIEEESANIKNLIQQLRKKKMPYITYDALPEEATIDHFDGISFILLDWKLIPKEISESVIEGVKTPDTLSESQIVENIDFIKKIKERYFVPIFIFTNEDVEVIINKLKENDLFYEDKKNSIFVKRKEELVGRIKLFIEIEKWAKNMPSIYIMKVWDKEYQRSKNSLFNELYQKNPSWPKILWKCFEADKVDKSKELGEVITRNLYTRMSQLKFDENILKKRGLKKSKEEIRKVLEGERFIKYPQPNAYSISTGDVFKEEKNEDGETEYIYYINIRAQCDLVGNSNPYLYCLKGRIVDESILGKKKGIPISEGSFIEKINHTIIPFIDGNKIIEFLFWELRKKKWNTMKNMRIGKLLPPYITRIQQRYAFFLVREGLPRIPDEAI
ncbi:hypothetical protein ACFLT2_10360 [Acidobacteriota bacterium]